MIFEYDSEPVLILRIVISLEAILMYLFFIVYTYRIFRKIGFKTIEDNLINTFIMINKLALLVWNQPIKVPIVLKRKKLL